MRDSIISLVINVLFFHLRSIRVYLTLISEKIRNNCELLRLICGKKFVRPVDLRY